MKKFFVSPWFNALLAVLAAVLIILQEVWIGTALVFLPLFTLGACAGLGFSWIAEVIKYIVNNENGYKWKRMIPGAILGVIAALVTALLVV
jgi:hypothetical protein